MAKYILSYNKLTVLDKNGNPTHSFKVKNPMEGLDELMKERKGVAIVKDTFAITQAQYHGSFYFD